MEKSSSNLPISYTTHPLYTATLKDQLKRTEPGSSPLSPDKSEANKRKDAVNQRTHYEPCDPTITGVSSLPRPASGAPSNGHKPSSQRRPEATQKQTHNSSPSIPNPQREEQRQTHDEHASPHCATPQAASRLFRAEALRIRPIHQLLADIGLRTLLYRRGSMVVFDSARDTVVLNLRNRSPSGLMLDALLDSLFGLAKGTCTSPSLKCVFKIGPKAHSRASVTHGMVLGSALRHPQFPSLSTATLVREKGKLGIWQVAVDFKMR